MSSVTLETQASGDYLHLSGRTGRMGASGTAITIVSDGSGRLKVYRRCC